MGFSYREFGAALSAHDVERVASLVSDDIVFEDLGMGVTHQGSDAFAASVQEATNFSADMRIEVLDELVTNGRFVAEWVMTGTTEVGRKSGRVPFTIRGATVGHLDDADRVVRAADYWNMASLTSQLRAGSSNEGMGR